MRQQGVFAVEKHDTPGSLGRLADFGMMVASTVCSRPEPIHAILPVGQGGTPPVATTIQEQ